MALAPWNVLAAGKIRTDAEEAARRETGEKGRMLSSNDWERNEDQKKVCTALEKVAGEIGAKTIQAGRSLSEATVCMEDTHDFSVIPVAIAYVMQKAPFVFPIIGGRKVEHLNGNIEALNITLSEKQIEYLEGILPFDKGFPYTAFVSPRAVIMLHGLGGTLNVYFRRATAATTTGSSRLQASSTNGLNSHLYVQGRLEAAS